MPLMFLLVLFILAVPFLLIFGFFHLVTFSFENLGLSPSMALVVFAAMLIGSLINIPLKRQRIQRAERRSFFGLVRSEQFVAQGLTLNVGGGLIPAVLAFYFFSFVPLQEALIATAIMIIIMNRFSRVIPGKGIGVPTLFPAIAAAIISYILSPEYAAPIAFAAGVFGVLIGADMLHIWKFKKNAGIMSIGGAGVFDGIFLIAIISALLTTL